MAKTSKIILSKNIKLDRNYQNTLTYSESQMVTLCTTNMVTQATNFSFIREEENYIRVPFTYEDCMKSNYIAFQNPRYSNKWFFAFIDGVEYVSDGACNIRFTIDHFATWFSYWSPTTTFVEREHVNDDTIGLHTIPENLETGEYIHPLRQELFVESYETYIVIGVSELIENNVFNPRQYNTQFNGIFSGLMYLIFETPTYARIMIDFYDNEGKADAINNVFLVPKSMVGNVTFSLFIPDSDPGSRTYCALMPNSTDPILLAESGNITSPTRLGTGYDPINNKLYVYPYNCFYVSNGVGNDVVYHYEDFVDNIGKFKIYGDITPGCSIKAIPINYKKCSDFSDSLWSANYGITGAKFPICSWVSDVYTNWLTQNGVNIAGTKLNQEEASILGGVGGILAGAGMLASGNVLGAGLIAGGVGGMFNSMQNSYRKSLTPDQARGNIASGDVSYSTHTMGFRLYYLTLKNEYLEAIDNYFTRFGYKVTTLKVPNITGRQYFNYLQIGKGEVIGYSNNLGSVPAESMEIINNIFRNGTTLWHNHGRIGNYTENTIIT